MNASNESIIYKLIESNFKVLWAGKNSPLPSMESCPEIYSEDSIFRTSPKLHRNYDCVLSHEFDLAMWKQWPLILDELLRLLKPEGILSIRYSQSRFFSVFHFKNLLYEITKHQVEILEENSWDDGTRILTLKIKNQLPVMDKSWTFGVIYDGSKVENLQKFIESIRNQSNLGEFEILICGPVVENLKSENVRFITFEERFKEHGWITEKKNKIVDNAKFENICIVHNRYILDQNFLKNFEQFGYDFDVVVTRQEDLKGQHFPDWTTIGASWKLTSPAQMKPYDYSPFLYVNGGMIIAKRSVLLAIPWNPLIFWNQAEDVELSRRMASRGIIPRYNKFSTAYVLEARPGYISYFAQLPYEKDSYVVPLDPSQLVTDFVFEGTSYRLSKVSFLHKGFSLVSKFMRVQIVRMFWILKPLYLKLRPYLSQSKILSKIVQKIRLNLDL